MGIDFRGFMQKSHWEPVSLVCKWKNRDSERLVNFSKVTASKWQSLHLNLVVWLRNSKGQAFSTSAPGLQRGGQVAGGKSSHLSLPSGHPTSNAPLKRLSPRVFYVQGDGHLSNFRMLGPSLSTMASQGLPSGFSSIPAGLAEQFTGYMDKLN